MVIGNIQEKVSQAERKAKVIRFGSCFRNRLLSISSADLGDIAAREPSFLIWGMGIRCDNGSERIFTAHCCRLQPWLELLFIRNHLLQSAPGAWQRTFDRVISPSWNDNSFPEFFFSIVSSFAYFVQIASSLGALDLYHSQLEVYSGGSGLVERVLGHCLLVCRKGTGK